MKCKVITIKIYLRKVITIKNMTVEELFKDFNPLALAILGTLFTWFVTALGAAVVFLIPQSLSTSLERKLLDGSLGFSAGVMLAATFWSLLIPALEQGNENHGETYGFIPATVGFLIGCVVVQLSDLLLPDPDDFRFLSKELKEPKVDNSKSKEEMASARRIMLLIIAMTIHNFPEGLAVGVAFGSIGFGKSTLSKAIVLTIAIGLQNFPEGLAVSLPLQRQIGSKKKAFFWGQLSGSVELLGGIIGAYLVETSQLLLPYALGFAGGAMVFVVVDSIIPESQAKGNKVYATWGAIVGFLLMMLLEVLLG